MLPRVDGPILDIRGLSKTYKGGTVALAGVDLQIRKGEIFALLGPNGAGKTTLIGAVCGLLRPSGGTIEAFGLDVQRHWRQVRRRIGLVPQELAFDMFARVDHAVQYSRGMFGCPPNPARIEEVLRSLSLWDKREAKIRELSGGMKRRVMIAKALSHDPELLFLDEPTAGVDVELRRDMWRQIGALRARGTTIILTTHYIEEAQEMADRVGVINKGELILVEEKTELMKKLGRKVLHLQLAEPLKAIPAELSEWKLELSEDGGQLTYEFDAKADRTGVPSLLAAMRDLGIAFKDLDTHQSSLEDIFVGLIHHKKAAA